MNGSRRGALLSAVLLLGGVGCGGPEEAGELRKGAGVALQELSTDPDFVVTKVTAPSSAMPGSTFEATVEVCNRGGMGSGVDLNLYFSDDDVITPSDFWAQSLYVGYLDPGQCQSQSVWITASVPTEGPWYVGAYADPYGSQFEGDENNNSLASPVMGIGNGPDFVITSVKGPASADNGQPIITQVTVCNRGTQPGGTDVEVYLSADEAIYPNVPPNPPEDSLVGRTWTDYLYPGQCSTVSVSGSAYVPPPGGAGPYYVGAVVDPQGTQLELIEDNNARAGYRMGVGLGPDFVITSVKGPSSAGSGQSISAQVTVCNRGTQAAGTDVEVYLSEDETLNPNVAPNPPEDSLLGGAWTDSLYPGQCTTVSVSGNAYPPPPGFEGPYYVGAVADPHGNQFELIEDNNALAGYRMGVGYRPDFVIASVKGPPSARSGQLITAQVTVCNRGMEAGYGDVEVHLSADELISPNVPPGPPADYVLGMAPTDYLYPGQCNTVPVSGNAYAPPPGAQGSYFVGAVVDPNDYQPELIEDNNTLAGYRMGLGNGADFVVTSVKGPSSATSGQPITVQVTVCNQGTEPGSTDAGVYLSADDTIRSHVSPNPPEDYFLGMAPTDYLYPGQCRAVAVSGSAYPPPPGSEGPYYVGGVVDPYGNQPELIEDNNTLAGSRMGVGNRPDFVIRSVKGPSSATNGQSITAQVTVCNQGTQSGSTRADVYLSADDTLRANVPPNPPEDSWLGSAYTDFLTPGQCRTVPVSGNAWPPAPGNQGPYYLGAVVDQYGDQPELIEDNNTLAGYRMGLGNGADFVVTAVTGPSGATHGQAITTQVTVCNRGTQADSTDVEVYLSSDDVIRGYVFPNPPEDSQVGMASTGYLYPSQCATVPVNGYAYAPPPGFDGPYYVGAVVDPAGSLPELIEDNNSLAGYRMGVGNRADFVITAVKGPASAQSGQAITAQVTVCNRGTQPDSTDVEVYLSADDVIRGNQQQYPSEDSFVGMAPTGPLSPNQCVTVPVSGYANVPPPGFDGPYYVGAVANPYGGQQELITDNNTLAGYRMGVGSKPDFVITAVTGPFSAQSGQAIAPQVTVCNQGMQPGSTDVEVYLSADDVLRGNVPPGPPPEDSYVGMAPTGSLAPGQCATVPVNGYANVPPPGSDGPYYVGAVVDPYGGLQELIEDNNSLAGYRMGVGSKADYVITSVTGPYSATPGNSFTVSVGICNRGQQSDTMDVELYLSADTNVRVPTPPGPPEDFYLGTVTGVSLAVGACTTKSLSVTAPSVPEGAWYLGAVADPFNSRPELIEDNNAKAGNVIGVGSKADFVITAMTGPYSTRPGAAFTANVTVCNRGQMADTTDVELYLSADTNVRVPAPPGPPEDFYLGTVTGVSLAVGACTTKSLSVTAPSVPEGAWYLGAVADPFNSRSELIEDNNAKAGNVIGVGSKADFVVTALTGPSSIKLGAAFTASVTVCNRGQMADVTDVDLFFSADSIIRVPAPSLPPEDFYLGTVSAVSLPAGACSTRSIVVNGNVPSTGSYYLGGVADAANSRSELIEDNNTKAGTYMSVIP